MLAASARLFEVNGPSERNQAPLRVILEQLRAGADEIQLEQPGCRRDYVHVADAARALVELLGHDCGYRVYNLGTGSDYSDLEVAQLVASDFDREVEIVESDGADPPSHPRLVADNSRIAEEIG